MKKIFFILVFGCFLISCSSKENLDEIHKKVDIFHAYYDKSEYREIYYVMTSKEYKDSIAFKKHNQFLGIVKKSLGNFSRKKEIRTNINYQTNRNIITIVYKTKFEKGEGTETFTFIKSANRNFELYSYYIESPELLKNGKELHKLLYEK